MVKTIAYVEDYLLVSMIPIEPPAIPHQIKHCADE
jgi:hypothetical protein